MTRVLFLVGTLALAQGPDLHRNARVQKLSAHVLAAQSAYDTEMKSWIAECEKKGLQLRPVAGNLMDCMPAPQQAPRVEPSKPAKPQGETK
jgi:hypothetical protein